MLRRFRKKNMLLEDLPTRPAPNTLYPNVLSAEYFQGIQENTLFNFLGYNSKPKEAYGVMIVRLQRDPNVYDGPVQNPNANTRSFVGVGEGRVFPGTRSIQVNVNNNSLNVRAIGDPETGPLTGSALTGEVAGKIEGTESFTSGNHYTVQLTVDQFIGVDFSGRNPSDFPDDIHQVNPVINPHPNYQGIIYSTGGLDPTFATNRHDERIRGNLPDRETRSTFISMSVFEQSATYFKVYVKRSNVWAEVQSGPLSTQTAVAVVNDYKRDANVSATHVVYVPNNDPVDILSPIPVMDMTGVTAEPRDFLRISWYAKGV